MLHRRIPPTLIALSAWVCGSLLSTAEASNPVFRSFACSGLPADIPDDAYVGVLDGNDAFGPDAGMACCSVLATGVGWSTLDVNLKVAVHHLWLGDLTIKVKSPGGTVVTVQSRAGLAESADDGNDDYVELSSNAQWLYDLITYDDDESAPPAELMGMAGSPTCTGGGSGGNGVCAHIPDHGAAAGGGLSDFDGEDPRGTWEICVGDNESGDEGTLENAEVFLLTPSETVFEDGFEYGNTGRWSEVVP